MYVVIMWWVVFLAQKLLVALKELNSIRIMFLLVKQGACMIMSEAWVVLGSGGEGWAKGVGGVSLSTLLSMSLS